MHLHSVFISLSDSEIEKMLTESDTFRRAVVEYLKKNKTKPKKKKLTDAEKVIENLKNQIRQAVPGYSYTDKIVAIKYFRSFPFSEEQKNELKKLGTMDADGYIGLVNAKGFIESL
jgi:molecular chaperone DnaK (HSP70)